MSSEGTLGHHVWSHVLIHPPASQAALSHHIPSLATSMLCAAGEPYRGVVPVGSCHSWFRRVGVTFNTPATTRLTFLLPACYIIRLRFEDKMVKSLPALYFEELSVA